MACETTPLELEFTWVVLGIYSWGTGDLEAGSATHFMVLPGVNLYMALDWDVGLLTAWRWEGCRAIILIQSLIIRMLTLILC